MNSWKKGKHKRVLLMFNDLVVVTKKNKEQYMFKQSFSLLNATAVSYQSAGRFVCLEQMTIYVLSKDKHFNTKK